MFTDIYYVPGIILSTCYSFSHLIQKPYQVGTVTTIFTDEENEH